MTPPPTPLASHWLNKVPEVTLSFWIIKIMSTTVGETGADFLAVNAGWGHGVTRAVMCALLAAALVMQLRTRCYTSWVYWLTVVLVSVVGTQITEPLTNGLGISLYVSTAVFAVDLAAILAVWYGAERSLSIHDIVTRRRELFTGWPSSARSLLAPPLGTLRPKPLDSASPGARPFLAP